MRKIYQTNKLIIVIIILFLSYLLDLIESSISENILTINEKESQQILHNSYNILPDQILVNDINAAIGRTVYLTNNKNIIKMRWNKVITNCYYMLANLNNVIEIDISNFDSSQVTTMERMFHYYINLKKIIFGKFNTSLVENMNCMFCDCYQLTSLDLLYFDTSKVTDMTWVFDDCWELTSLDLSNFNTKKVKKMNYMFYCCKKLEYVNFRNIDGYSLINMEGVSNIVKN